MPPTAHEKTRRAQARLQTALRNDPYRDSRKWARRRDAALAEIAALGEAREIEDARDAIDPAHEMVAETLAALAVFLERSAADPELIQRLRAMARDLNPFVDR